MLEMRRLKLSGTYMKVEWGRKSHSVQRMKCA